jgi:hypothetical protein
MFLYTISSESSYNNNDNLIRSNNIVKQSVEIQMQNLNTMAQTNSHVALHTVHNINQLCIDIG